MGHRRPVLPGSAPRLIVCYGCNRLAPGSGCMLANAAQHAGNHFNAGHAWGVHGSRSPDAVITGPPRAHHIAHHTPTSTTHIATHLLLGITGTKSSEFSVSRVQSPAKTVVLFRHVEKTGGSSLRDSFKRSACQFFGYQMYDSTVRPTATRPEHIPLATPLTTNCDDTRPEPRLEPLRASSAAATSLPHRRTAAR